jgi:divalent metal cation (Fe/Co/Zn/Cd) transporter
VRISPSSTGTEALERRAVRLEWATIAWNAAEAVVSIAAGVAAGSVALVGFGLDSVVEVMAAGVVLWELRGAARERERRALRLIGVSFFLLAAYVVAESVRDLAGGREPDESPVGIAMAACSLLAMPALARAKRRTGRLLHRHALEADAGETALCAWLSAVLLAGLVLNATAGWWWADPLAALLIAALAVREGREAWRGHDCC